MRKISIKEELIFLRNGLAFCFSWLVICVMLLALFNKAESISVGFLFKLLGLSFWAVFCFGFCFRNLVIRKKGFIFRLTVFCLIFIPAEVLFFFFMGLFNTGGTYLQWCIFVLVILVLYGACALIDFVVCRKQGELITGRLTAYNERRANEQPD